MTAPGVGRNAHPIFYTRLFVVSKVGKPGNTSPKMVTRNLEPTITDMLAEIELDLHKRKVTDDSDPAYGAYFVARLEMERGQPPNLAYVHNVLAASLNRPLATRH